jgi:hypothetical protein
MKKIKKLRLNLGLDTVRRLTTSNLEQVHGGIGIIGVPKSFSCSVQLDCGTSLETRNCPYTTRCDRQ